MIVHPLLRSRRRAQGQPSRTDVLSQLTDFITALRREGVVTERTMYPFSKPNGSDCYVHRREFTVGAPGRREVARIVHVGVYRPNGLDYDHCGSVVDTFETIEARVETVCVHGVPLWAVHEGAPELVQAVAGLTSEFRDREVELTSRFA
jgi:hypothetical protein